MVLLQNVCQIDLKINLFSNIKNEAKSQIQGRLRARE